MKQAISHFMATATVLIAICWISSCQKTNINEVSTSSPNMELIQKATTASEPHFNLQVVLRGEGKRFGHIKFRQDNDVEKVIDLGVWVKGLDPNRSYQLQRAVDAINVVDGVCTSSTWLTLGKGLAPYSIQTDEIGTGAADLWRSVASVPSGSSFDIHFRVVEENTSIVVLSSDCYEYTVR